MRRREAGRGRTRGTGALALLAGLGACGTPTPEGDRAAGTEAAGEPAAPPTAARYLTHLLFAGAEGGAFFASFDQAAETDRLTRSYEVWWGGAAAWRPLLRMRDTLPTPRAGWRILPAGGMAVRVGDAGQLVGLTFRGASVPSGAPLRLEAGEELSVWTGPTGQRESLGVAVLEAGEAPEPGILFFRRAARALRIPPGGGRSRAFVLTDSVGNALLLEVGAEPDPASARTWLHGEAAAWSEVTFEASPDSPAREWRFAIVGAELAGTIRAAGPGPSAMEGVPASSAPFPIECLLRAGEESFRFVGVSALLELP